MTLETRALDSLKESIRSVPGAATEVGLFRNRAARTDTALENPTIGAWHEFGVVEENLPERSWLRMPLMTQLTPKRLAEIDWAVILQKRGIKRALAKLGAICLEIIHEAFTTRGFGQWASLRPRTIRKKGNSKILIDTDQMRKAVDFRVVEK